ncbi:hypothetical protein BJY04DRAFT_164754 [Aspergillus karnatakaensis]|uniref:bZIP transcription factor n=1 Tax=Aspergillus karnatakaensis TaxID=1810916 RepID=UPI003CCE4D4A
MEIAQSSPSTPAEGAQKKRRRTEAQLARKRQADRINHKAKREQQKRQMETLETQVTNLQEAVQSLTEQVRVLNERLRDQTRYFSCFDFTGTETPSPIAAAAAAAANSSTSLDQPRPLPNAQDMLLLSADKLPMLVPGPALGEPDNNVPVDCRCGVDHRSYYECLEYSTFSILLRAHQGLNKSISNSTRLPRTPSLVHVFRPTSTDNPVIQILGLVFSQVRPANVRTLFACYVVMYRFLRWRLCPDEETQRDVPPWLYPTEIQKTIPHPVCIDFLPWPGLRDRLIRKSQQFQDPRHSVILYMRSVHFQWSEDQEFIYTSENGELMPTEAFETGLYQYENWQVSAEWAGMFPKLRKHVNVGEAV